jgi:hypothetical protein
MSKVTIYLPEDTQEVEVIDLARWLQEADYPEGTLAVEHRQGGTVHYRKRYRRGFEFVRQTIGRVG